MKLLLINSNPDNSFAAFYSDKQFVISLANDFMSAEEQKNHNKSPDKLIHCLYQISSLGELNLSEIDAVSVTIGPGSFTGIRVGIAVAKGAAYPLGKKIIPVSNFELALNRVSEIEKEKKYCVLIQAKPPEYYYSIYQNNEEKKSGLVQISEINTLIDNNTAVVGDFSDETMRNLSYFRGSVIKNLIPESKAMAELSLKLFESGIMSSPADIKPLYMKDFVIRNQTSKI